MNEQWMEEIKHNDVMIFLEKYFPGQSFGNKTEQIAELCRIAEKSGFTDSESIRKIVSVQIGEDAMSFHDETIASDGRRIIGKKYISDVDASKSGACKACLEYAGRIFKWPEEADKMPVLPRHPNCKCHYEDVYEENNVISPLSPEKIIMPNMTPHQWDEQSKEAKLNWCNLFKTKFSEYISTYSSKYNVPKSLLTIIIANELIDWQNIDGTVFDGIRGGGVGYAQIAIDTLLKEGISGYEDELIKKIRSNKFIPDSLIYRNICGKIHKDLLTTEGSVKFAAKLLRKGSVPHIA